MEWGTLFYEILRIFKEKKPKYLLLENVKGITAIKFCPIFVRIKEILKKLGYGDITYSIFNQKIMVSFKTEKGYVCLI